MYLFGKSPLIGGLRATLIVFWRPMQSIAQITRKRYEFYYQVKCEDHMTNDG
jgi:hypothetical protein